MALNAPYIVYAVRVPKDVDPKSVGVDFKHRDGFLFEGKNCWYGNLFLKDKDGNEERVKIMVVKNKYYNQNKGEADAALNPDTTEVSY